MEIIKGQRVHVFHLRKGDFDGVATRDFNTDTEEWYPIALAKGNFLKGLSLNAFWEAGDGIPCRKSLTTLILLNE